MVSGKVFTGIKTALEKLFKTSGATLRNVLIFVLVFGLERIFEKDVFRCPEKKHRLYGISFLVCPAVSLFVLTLLLNANFWNVLTGCRLSQFRPLFVFKRVVSMVFQAFLPPGVWIVVALIQTNYYVCMQLGPKETAIKKATRNTTDAKKIKEIKYEIERKFYQAQCESHMMAWSFFISLILFAFVIVCTRRCLFLQADGILPDLDDYDKLEAEAAVDSFKERIKEIASSEGKSYIDGAFEYCKTEPKLKTGYSQVKYIRKQLARKYPRTTGDLSQPYRAEGQVEEELNENRSKEIIDDGHYELRDLTPSGSAN
ncbi:calcium homeostasis modulator protein 6 [Exaiptasia diaphana]|uniref:Uncharacterized protein n=1 Tax=Exaiptasia diaphana TaxID=2652724 RepID=A0A913Y3L6_EXADI|nr:calcium homeostasis modulator protein 6 [Exaiptasia diaphana]KXJ22836.1 Protein FAM26F [Exaiptasia diaphana]